MQTQGKATYVAKPPPSFSQNFKGGVFIDLESGPPDDGGVETPGYAPSSMEPEGECSARSPFESGGESADPREPPIESGNVDDVLFGDDVVFDACNGGCDLSGNFSIPLEAKQELSSLSATSADVSDACKQKVEVKLNNVKCADQLRQAVAKQTELGAWLKHSVRAWRGTWNERNLPLSSRSSCFHSNVERFQRIYLYV